MAYNRRLKRQCLLGTVDPNSEHSIVLCATTLKQFVKGSAAFIKRELWLSRLPLPLLIRPPLIFVPCLVKKKYMNATAWCMPSRAPSRLKSLFLHYMQRRSHLRITHNDIEWELILFIGLGYILLY